MSLTSEKHMLLCMLFGRLCSQLLLYRLAIVLMNHSAYGSVLQSVILAFLFSSNFSKLNNRLQKAKIKQSSY